VVVSSTSCCRAYFWSASSYCNCSFVARVSNSVFLLVLRLRLFLFECVLLAVVRPIDPGSVE